MANMRTMQKIVAILAMMLMVPLTVPDSAFAKKSRSEYVSEVRAACEQLKKSIAEGEKKREDGTITDHERGELNSEKELYDHLACDIVLAVRDSGQTGVGDKDSDVGVAPKEDDCTWKNLWCVLAPVFEAAQTAVSPSPGPTNPLPEPLPLLDPRPEPPDPLPPAPVPLSELSEESSGDPDSSGSADVNALAKNNSAPDGYTCKRMLNMQESRRELVELVEMHETRCAALIARITNPKPTWELPKSPTNAGVAQNNVENVASPSEVQGEVSSDQYSSGEATEISVDSGVELSEGSTTEAIK